MVEWLAFAVGAGLVVLVVLVGLFGPEQARASARALLAVLVSRGAAQRGQSADSVTSVSVTETVTTTRNRTVAVSGRTGDGRNASGRELP